MWCHNDVTDMMSQYSMSQNEMLEVGRLFLSILNVKKIDLFNFWLREHLAFKMNPIKINKEWSNLNTQNFIL